MVNIPETLDGNKRGGLFDAKRYSDSALVNQNTGTNKAVSFHLDRFNSPNNPDVMKREDPRLDKDSLKMKIKN